MIPDSLRETLETHLDVTIDSVAAVGGGCIANACRVETDGAPFFLKYGDEEVARTFPGEAAGLEALAAADSPLTVPSIRETAPPTDDRPGFLVMEWINSGRRGRRFWERFGEGLAALHRHAAEAYGFDDDNFIGQSPQPNEWMDEWPAFFRSQRLEPQVQMARERGRWQSSWNRPLETLYRRLPELLPETPDASVLHGDLWKGNFMVTAVGEPAIIDPATYYGHREADLAMTELFGGFQDRFYDAYRSAWALDPGYETRRDIYNLYHLLNHLNLFGAGYANSVQRTLNAVV
ncbi:fructosamine kinase [Salinibacter sp. 10B]|uniref:fructosamine kinase family protein n=1 Tax=Salinibacter sp. 10B TaxID=1923971 RepID=UPI000CF53FD8|nr:fructosamine kinase family protein [Salinibacter sp. 10B]PQJ34356.1 fructosamine kinase [Salinibacter sp. 10B]